MHRPRRRTVVLCVGGVILLWSVAAAWLLVDARSSVQSGRQRLESVRGAATPSSLLDPATGRDLDRASDDFSHARDRLRSLVLSPLRVLPVVGRHVRAADRVVGTAGGATEVARRAVDELGALKDRPLASGPDRLAALDDLDEIVARAEVGLSELDTGSPDSLIGPLGDAVATLEAERRESLVGLQRAQRVVRAVRQVLDGPTPYLLLGANNAEMRAGSGMMLSAAELELAGGRMSLGDVRPTDQLVLPEGSVEVAPDLAANWPWIDAGRDFRSMGLTVDFPQVGPMAAANWTLVPGGGAVGGVIVVDVDALRGLLRVVGPVEVDGVRYSADTVRGELLRKQYERFGDDRPERRDQLGAVAHQVFARIDAGDFEIDELASALIDASVRRNLMVWSSDPRSEQAWADAGVDGRLRDDSVSVALVNRGAEKLDSYIDTTAELVSREGPDGRVEVTITYRINNGAPASGPRYLLGPNIDGLAEGEHRAIVVANLPAGSTGVDISGVTPTIGRGADGSTVVVAGTLSVLRGRSAEVHITATVPGGLDQVHLEPSARISPTKWTVDGRSFDIDRRRTVSVGP